MSESNFRFDRVLAAKDGVDQDRTWTGLEGRIFGAEGPYPLKIYVGTGSEHWTTGWQEGADQFSRRLKSRKKKQRFAEQCMNPAIMPQEALAMANKKGIERSGCLLKVAWRGPEFKSESDLKTWVSGESEYLLGDEPCAVPKDVLKLYVLEDKVWRVPISTEPPAEWLATKEQIKSLMEEDLFNVQVGNARRVLEEDGSDGEDESGSKNSEGGPSPKRRGTPSQKKSE